MSDGAVGLSVGDLIENWGVCVCVRDLTMLFKAEHWQAQTERGHEECWEPHDEPEHRIRSQLGIMWELGVKWSFVKLFRN